MYSPQNPVKSPEFGPINSVGPVASSPIATSGELRFNQAPLQSTDPQAIINTAIAGGDTIEKRTKQFDEAVDRVTSEQK